MKYIIECNVGGEWKRSKRTRAKRKFYTYTGAQFEASWAERTSSGGLKYRVVADKKCPWWKPHYMLPFDTRNVVTPEAGPFDPRTEEERTTKVQMEICAYCGETRKYEDTYDGY